MVRSIGSWILMMWAVALFACESARSAPPRITTPVTDNANVLEATQRDALSARLAAHRERTGVQVALLTVATLRGEPIEDFSHRTAVAWGGGSRANNDGVLVTLAVQDRRSRIEVGYGLEAELTDGRTRVMLDSARPFLRRADYAGAFGSILDGIEARTQGRPAPTAAPAFRMGPAVAPPADDTAMWWVLLGAVLAVVFVVVLMLRAETRRQEAARQRELDEELEAAERNARREAERRARMEAARRDQERFEAARKERERRDAEQRARANADEAPAPKDPVSSQASHPPMKSSPADGVHQATRAAEDSKRRQAKQDAEDARRRRQAAQDAEAARRRRQEQQDAEDARRRRQAAEDEDEARRRSSSSGWNSGWSSGSSTFGSSSSSSDSGSSSWGSSDSSGSSSDSWSGGGGDFGGGGSSGDW